MKKKHRKQVYSVIQRWCEFHLDEGTSRWDRPKDDPHGFVYAGDGIQAALKEAGFKIVPT